MPTRRRGSRSGAPSPGEAHAFYGHPVQTRSTARRTAPAEAQRLKVRPETSLSLRNVRHLSRRVDASSSSGRCANCLHIKASGGIWFSPCGALLYRGPCVARGPRHDLGVHPPRQAHEGVVEPSRGARRCAPTTAFRKHEGIVAYDRFRHHRRSVRLRGYDYGQPGAYSVTLVTHGRQCLFGHIADGTVALNECGRIVEEEWLRSARIRDDIALDSFLVMPNHLHGIIVIRSDRQTITSSFPPDAPAVGAHRRAPLSRPPRCVGSFVAGFKSAVTTRINALRGTPGSPVWQRSYHDHVIRDRDDLFLRRRYIVNNPLQWALDEENPANVG